MTRQTQKILAVTGNASLKPHIQVYTSAGKELSLIWVNFERKRKRKRKTMKQKKSKNE